MRRSRFISEPLTLDADQSAISAVAVIISGLDPMRVAEIIFRQISVKMPFAAMLIDADHAALEDGEIALRRIHGDNSASFSVPIGIFLARMIDAAM